MSAGGASMAAKQLRSKDPAVKKAAADYMAKYRKHKKATAALQK